MHSLALYARPGVHALQPARALLRAVSVMSTTCNFSMSRGDHWTNRRHVHGLWFWNIQVKYWFSRMQWL
jgi:hypothetical protein